MKLHGTIMSNLQDAIGSAKRLRGHPVYPDTIAYWNELLREGRRYRAELDDADRAPLDAAIVHLESALAERNQSRGQD
jgi:hypothetical protein